MLVLSPHLEQGDDPRPQVGVPLDSVGPRAALRRRAIADANALRALAWAALRDGMPRAQVRAATSRASARAVIAHARRLSVILEKGDRPWTRGLRRYAVA